MRPPNHDTPFGLEPHVAAGLAYLFSWLGGVVMLVGGGTNSFVRWAAAQSIVLGVAVVILYVALGFLAIPMYMAGLSAIHTFLAWLLNIAWLAVWLWTFISGFQGKEVRVPVIANITDSALKSSAG